ncbi:MAG: hypothetical protein IKW46_08355 [Bacteroidaceae bacterium]|nr:hypothetical protein [Bacteroidaceae bacterium]
MGISIKTGKAVLLASALSLFSCVSKVEEPAEDLLARARVEYENGKYNNTRVLLDSIKIVSPKAYKALREAEKLRREAMIKENESNVKFFEDELKSLVAVRDSMAAAFDFNFDKRYQSKGYYTAPTQAVALNVYNNFLRACVYEDGTMYLTSFYRGKSIKHKCVKLSSGDTYVSCDKPFLERNFKDLGVNNERRDYKYGEDGGLVDFVLASQDDVTVELSGANGTVSYTLRSSDAVAIRDVFELSQAIKAVKRVEEMLGQARYMLEFLKRSEARSSASAE